MTKRTTLWILVFLFALASTCFAEPIIVDKTSTQGMTQYSDHNYASITGFDDGVTTVSTQGWSPKIGLMNKTGKEIVPPTYERVKWSINVPTCFSEDVTVVRKDGKWGFLNKQGVEIIKPRYDDADYFFEGLAGFKLGDKWGYLDKTGAVVIQTKFEDVGYFSEGCAPVKLNGKWGFIDKQGTLRIQPQFDWTKDKDQMSPMRPIGFTSGLAVVLKNGKYGFIDPDGKTIIPFQYDSLTLVSEGLIGVKRGGLWGVVNMKQAAEVLAPKYDDMKAFSNGAAAVYKLNYTPLSAGSLWGYIDNEGKEIIPPSYEDAGDFGDGLAFVTVKDMAGLRGMVKRAYYISKTGEKVLWVKIAETNQGLEWALTDSKFKEGLAPIPVFSMASMKWVFIDKTGNVVLSTKQ